MLKRRSIRYRLCLLAPLMAVTMSLGGCLPDQFGQDLLASSVSAVTGDVLFTALDWILPRPPV